MARLIVNGAEREVDAAHGRTLLDVLREDLGLTGTKYGCGEGECGACTVLLDGAPERSCRVAAEFVGGASVTTVEGLSDGDRLHPVQAAFVDARALQCGYCTPGMVLSAMSLLARDPAPDEAAIRAAMAGNICRCGGYPQIVRAIQAVARGGPGSGSRLVGPAQPLSQPGAGRGDEAGPNGWTAVVRFPDGSTDSRGRWGWSIPGGAALTVDVDGHVVAYTGKVDGGQGNRAALTRLVAAGLGADTSAVRLEMGDTAAVPFDLGTFGSRSTPDAGHAFRLLAATLRDALVGEAARQWQADADELTVAGGVVRHPGSGRSASFGALVATGPRTVHADPDADLPPVPASLSDVDDEAMRRGLAAAVTGAKRFPSDVALPGMWHGAVLRPPARGAELTTVDTTAAGRQPDVVVVRDQDFVGVVAPTQHAARRALGLVEAQWRTTPQPGRAELEPHLRGHPRPAEGRMAAANRRAGDVDAAIAAADICLAATYTTAYLAHVPMEPRVAVARVDGDTATVWVGTQRPFGVREAVAGALGLDEIRVRVVVPDFGGAFGGKHTVGAAAEAARLARATGRPVKVAWSREEEFSWAYFRPAAVIDVRSAATRDGTVTAWDFTNINSGTAGLAAPYAVPNLRERHQPADSPLPQGSYRALAATANNFARESHIDELAVALGVDPVELRLRHLNDDRLARALTAVAERVEWASRGGEGLGLGIACGIEKGARIATAAQVTVDPDGSLRLRRVVTALDCGAVVDPTGLRNQIVGATIMGLGGALFEAVEFEGGRVTNASLATYRVPRFPDVPPIDVIVLDHPDCESAGAGETPIIGIAPAIANAAHAATGRRVRDLPLTVDGRIR